jgi:hypothetical protein
VGGTDRDIVEEGIQEVPAQQFVMGRKARLQMVLHKAKRK